MWVPAQSIFMLCATFGSGFVMAATSPKAPEHSIQRDHPTIEKESLVETTQDDNEVSRSWSGDLQNAWDADLEQNKYHEISAESANEGKILLSGPYGTLYVTFMKVMIDFFSYYARVIDKADAGGPDANLTKMTPNKDDMKNVLAEWRKEVVKFQSCSEAALDMEACLAVTRCLIESEVGKTIKPSYFVSFMEFHDQVSLTVMKDFYQYFGEGLKAEIPVCEGEPIDPNGDNAVKLAFIEQFEASSERQWRAVSAVASVQQAADLTERASATVKDATVTDFQDIWHPPCAALGCDKSSLLDIGQTLHGHLAELVEVNAPAPVIRMHVRAMRTAIKSAKNWVGQSSMKDFVVVLEGAGRHITSNRRYNQQLKGVGAVLDGAYALLMTRSGGGQEVKKEVASSGSSSGWWGRRRRRRRRRERRRRRNRRRRHRRRRRNRRRRRRWGIGDIIGAVVDAVVNVVKIVFSCVGVAAAVVRSYMKKIMFTPCCGVVFGISFGRAIGGSYLGDLLNGRQICTGFTFKIVFAAVIGAIAGDPAAAMTRFGVSIEAGININSCSGALNLGIAAGVSGLVVWADPTCVFGANLALIGAPMFKCASGLAIGLTVFCCNFNLLTQQHNCR